MLKSILLLDITKLNDLGWNAKIELSYGLKDTYTHYKNELKEKKLRAV